MDDEVVIEIIDIQGAGVCTYGHKVGDRFKLEPDDEAPGLCAWAYNSIFPAVMTLRYGGSFPWEGEKGTAKVCCPDPANPVVFKISKR